MTNTAGPIGVCRQRGTSGPKTSGTGAGQIGGYFGPGLLDRDRPITGLSGRWSKRIYGAWIQFPPGVSPDLIDNTGATFTPQIDLGLAPGIIDSTGTTFSPSISTVTAVAPDLITQTGATFTPQIDLGLAPALITSTGTTFSPSIGLGVTAGLIDSTGATFSPSIEVVSGPQPGLITSTGTTFSPSLGLDVAVALLDQSAAVFAPSAGLGAAPAVISSVGTPFSADVGLGVGAVALITSTGTVFAPAFEFDVELGLLSYNGTVFDLVEITGGASAPSGGVSGSVMSSGRGRSRRSMNPVPRSRRH